MREADAQHLNTLGRFCGKRDIPALTTQALQQAYGFARADVMVLFGGSILCCADVLAQAMREGVAKHYVIAGGEGHTTAALRAQIHAAYPELITQNLSEAEAFAAYLQRRHGLAPDFLETASTNCGNNITYLLALLREKGIAPQSIILTQDATMQHRMEAVLRNHVSADVTIINYAAYAVTVVEKNGTLAFSESVPGMWDMERYTTLLLGEIPRLTDDAAGYGPRGKGFLAHVDIPADVQAAFAALCERSGGKVREANPLYASQ